MGDIVKEKNSFSVAVTDAAAYLRERRRKWRRARRWSGGGRGRKRREVKIDEGRRRREKRRKWRRERRRDRNRSIIGGGKGMWHKIEEREIRNMPICRRRK